MASLLSLGINGPVFDVPIGLSSKRQSVTRCNIPGDGHIPPRTAHCAARSSCSLAAVPSSLRTSILEASASGPVS